MSEPGGDPFTPWGLTPERLLEDWPQLARALWEALQPGTAGARTAPRAPEAAALWPALGLTREHQEAWQRLAQLSARVLDAESRLAALWGELMQRALGALSQRVAEQFAAGQPVESLRSLYDLWIDAAERAYAEVAHASPYADVQAELTNALSALRIERRALLERWARDYDLPTRAELDSVHRRLKGLEARLRALEARDSPRPRAVRARRASRARRRRGSS